MYLLCCTPLEGVTPTLFGRCWSQELVWTSGVSMGSQRWWQRHRKLTQSVFTHWLKQELMWTSGVRVAVPALAVAVEADSLRNLVQDMDTDSLTCVQLLLRVGARIKTGYQFKTLFTQASDAEKNTLQVPALLLAAGEQLEVEQIKDVGYNPEGEILLFTPDAVKWRRREMALKTACRRRIRNHLLDLDSNRNLFLRVEQLPLAENLASYLVHNVSLDTELWERDWDFWKTICR